MVNAKAATPKHQMTLSSEDRVNLILLLREALEQMPEMGGSTGRAVQRNEWRTQVAQMIYRLGEPS